MDSGNTYETRVSLGGTDDTEEEQKEEEEEIQKSKSRWYRRYRRSIDGTEDTDVSLRPGIEIDTVVP